MAFDRIIVLVDMDCFYVQVEQRRDPEYKGKPCAVVQYKKYRGGGIIAVGYEARSCGVKRGMMGDDARKVCPDIHLFRVPESNGKANLDRYREAGAEVINVLSQFGGRVERASIDEAYIDLTDFIDKIVAENNHNAYLSREKLSSTHVIGYPTSQEENEEKEKTRQRGISEWLDKVSANDKSLHDLRLFIAAAIVEEIRAAVYHQTGFRCSAGISRNKMLSKLTCGINKPNKQTVLPKNSISNFFETIKIGKVRNLGGKLGSSLTSDFGVEFMSELNSIDTEKLVSIYGHKTAMWLKDASLGIDRELVKERHVAQSIGCGKNFLGPDSLNTKSKVKKWMDSLLIELSERLKKDKDANNRIARTLTVHFKLETGKSYSRSAPLAKYNHDSLLSQCLQLIRVFDTMASNQERWHPAIVQLSVNAKKFDNIGMSNSSIMGNVSSFFKPSQACDTSGGNPANVIVDKPHFDASISSSIWGLATNGGTASNSSTMSKLSSSSNKVDEISKYEFSAPKNTEKSSGFFSKRAELTTDDVNMQDQHLFGVVKSPKAPVHTNFVLENRNVEAISADSLSGNLGIRVESETFNGWSDSCSNDVTFESERKIMQSNLSGRRPSSSRPKLCKIDQMFAKEKANSSKVPNKKRSTLPDGNIFHPDFGEIDRNVFDDLPEDIQAEILKSYEITSSMIQPSQCASSSPRRLSTKHKSPSKGQRLISNFIPQSQRKENASPKVTSSKRTSTSPLARSTTKSRKDTVSSNSSILTSNHGYNAVPLGFFRQRSQLTSAIAKAISDDRQTTRRYIPGS